MTRAELVAEIRKKLGYNTGLTESYITDAIDNAQDMMEDMPESPWFMTQELQSLATIADTETVALPTDFKREIEEAELWYYDSTATEPWTELAKGSIPELRHYYSNVTQTSYKPKAYAVSASNIYIFPEPDAVYVLKWTYMGALTKMAADGDTNGWSLYAPYVLIGKAGMLLADNNRDKIGRGVFEKIYAEAYQRLWRMNEAREHAGQTYQRGGAD